LKKPNGKKWRIAYLEGGFYEHYFLNLQALTEGLKHLGWVSYNRLPKFEKYDARRFWVDFLSSNRVQSDTIEFVRDAFYSSEWNVEERKQAKKALLERLSQQKDIDLILALGSWSSKDLATYEVRVPVVSMSVSNPIKASIIPNAQDSGLDHFHTRVDPNRHARQLELFYHLIRFKKLGVILEDLEESWSYGSMDQVIDLAREKGFEVIACKSPVYKESSHALAEGTAIECFQKLSTKVDAVWISANQGISATSIKQCLSPLLKHGIPSFAQSNTERVKQGVLFSVERDWQGLGRFHADIMAKIFNGAKPRDLPMIYEETNKLAINLKTAEMIGFKPDEELMSLVSNVYTELAE